MNLLVDIGNTRTKWRLIDASIQCSDGEKNNAELSALFIQELLGQKGLKRVLLSCVGRSDIAGLFKLASERANVEFVMIRSKNVMSGIKFAYQDITTLGVDRCLAMVGAYRDRGVMVVDAGSAITADYVADDGRHCGGYIIPGCQMLMTSLNVGTSKISVEAVLGNDEPGSSTKACVGNGLTVLIESLMLGLHAKADAFGVVEFMLTGGDAEVLMRLCPDIGFQRKKNLVLDGLQRLVEIGEV